MRSRARSRIKGNMRHRKRGRRRPSNYMVSRKAVWVRERWIPLRYVALWGVTEEMLQAFAYLRRQIEDGRP